jgi:hypothetical protein
VAIEKPIETRMRWISLGGMGFMRTTGCDGIQRDATKNNKMFRQVTLPGKVSSMAKGKEGKELAVAEKPKAKIGRPLKIVSAEARKKAIEAARLGIPLDRIAVGCGFWNNGQGWQQYLLRNPDFAAELEAARFDGEVELSSVVRSCGPGWQGSAWLLERTRGYVARAQLEHTGKGGKELSVSGALLGAFGGSK